MTSKPTRADIDALVGPATPQFAFQLRARVRELASELSPDDELHTYAAAQIDMLDRLGYASSKAEDGPREASTRPGWAQIPSSAPVDQPLPRRSHRRP